MYTSTSTYTGLGRTGAGKKSRRGGYMFGFNGQMKDDEVYGAGNSYTAEFWQYDPRIGRRWNIDPVEDESVSSYACFINSPIYFSDPNGDKPGNGNGGEDPPATTGQAIKSGAVTGVKNFGIGMGMFLLGPIGGIYKSASIMYTAYKGDYETAGKSYLTTVAPVTVPFIAADNIKDAYDEGGKNAAIEKGTEEVVTHGLNAIATIVMMKIGGSSRSPSKSQTKSATPTSYNLKQTSILENKGSFTIIDGMLDGQIKTGENTVLFDAKVSIEGTNINITEISIYEENNFNSVKAQNSVGVPIILRLKAAIESYFKAEGFDVNLTFKRDKPAGSVLESRGETTVKRKK